MLIRLSIRDVVLIDRLDMVFGQGLSVLTGETGAGKSILLDSLGLALGDRADSGKVRAGADQLSVTAEFDLPSGHPAYGILKENDFSFENEPLLIRRTVSKDGRSRAYVNDQAISIGLLRTLGESLVEIHGQFDSHGMMNPATHLPVLDAYGATAKTVRHCKDAYRSWNQAAKALRQAEQDLASAQAEEEILRQAEQDLAALDPRVGQEQEYAERRSLLMNGEKLAEGLNAALQAMDTGGGGVEATLRAAQRALERVVPMAPSALQPVLEALDRAAVEAAEAHNQLDRAASDVELDPQALESVEERLFALRAQARKHGVDCDSLPDILAELRRRLRALDDGGNDLITLAKAEQAAKATYIETARKLSKARKAAAKTLDSNVSKELPPLKLERARFVTQIEELPESQWGADGLDKVAFEVATNPGSAPGPLGKIASGGELSRFMLALKVVLASASPIPTLVFDEVDAGIGGATAAAVGERLCALAGTLQVLVVTHSPQVAAKGTHHWQVSKSVRKGVTSTSIGSLTQEQRLEEVARMLAGETITAEARAAAAALLG
jgi:DNA repair protein RecN (Recombination protein N)